jgi:chemotaxis response regulator CheB
MGIMRLYRIGASPRQVDRAADQPFAALLRDGDQLLDVGTDSTISARFTEHIACDVICIDVENFRLDAVDCLRSTIARCKPLVVLDVNHWRLHDCQRTTLPDFLAALRTIFPLLYAVAVDSVHDLHDIDGACLAMYRHIASELRYPALLGAFDTTRLPKVTASSIARAR